MKFTYVLSGWEGSAADSTVYTDARRKGLLLPPGKYFLNLLVSFAQGGLSKGLPLIFPPFRQEPAFALVGHENDLGSRWLDDNHPGTEYEVRRVKDAVRYRCGRSLRQRVGRRFLEDVHYQEIYIPA